MAWAPHPEGMIETQALIGEVQGVLLRAARPSGLGVVVLSGSSGRVDVDRARLFADRGAVALAQKWWGGPGQAPGINEIPLEVFVRALDRLQAEGCTRFAVVGASKGAEACLLAATKDARIDLVVAISPAHVVWQNIGPGLDGAAWPPRSSFAWEGRGLPFIAYDPRAWPASGLRPAYRPLHEKSLRTFADDISAAVIPVETMNATAILVAGGADLLWPSDTAARDIADRLTASGGRVRLVEHPEAGHSPILPGEPALPEPEERAWGGSRAADRALGAAAWAAIDAWLAS